MICKPLYMGHDVIGLRHDADDFFVFFGNSRFNEKQFKRMFPDWKLIQTKQVHGNDIAETDGNHDLSSVLADGTITATPKVAVGIHTADCSPVLIFDPSQKKVAAVHAGWRGIEKKIIINAIEKLNSKKIENVKVWIGPNIKKDSFEVHNDVAEQLSHANFSTNTCVFPHPSDSTKKLVDLNVIALSQLNKAGISSNNIWVDSTDTFKSKDHYSYRRDGRTGRLISFICLV